VRARILLIVNCREFCAAEADDEVETDAEVRCVVGLVAVGCVVTGRCEGCGAVCVGCCMPVTVLGRVLAGEGVSVCCWACAEISVESNAKRIKGKRIGLPFIAGFSSLKF
jgi:hypothetical protein